MGGFCSHRRQIGAQPAGPVGMLMKTMGDKDASGSVDREEFKKYVSPSGSWTDADAVFSKADIDGNGQLSASEMEKAFRINTSAWPGLQDMIQSGKWSEDEMQLFLSVADANNDGVLSPSECFDLHRRLDGNGDGQVSADELSKDALLRASYGKQAEDLLSKFDKNGDQVLDPGEVENLAEGMTANQVFAFMQKADVNRDGMVTQDELSALVAKFDTDGDGKLSPKEWNAALQDQSSVLQNAVLPVMLFIQRKYIDPFYRPRDSTGKKLAYDAFCAGIQNKMKGGTFLGGAVTGAANSCFWEMAMPAVAKRLERLAPEPQAVPDLIAPEGGNLCICGAAPQVTFRPCGHKRVCSKCFAYMLNAGLLKCLQCGQTFEP